MKSTFLKGLATAFLIGLIVFLLASRQKPIKEGQYEISVGRNKVFVEIMDTPEKRAHGLSGRSLLSENEGMLFVFEEKDIMPAFWMKDMSFAIDIIWIDENFKIIGIEENLSPDTFPRAFSPSEPVKYVLETPAGWSKKNSIRVGDNVEKINFLE